MEGCLGVVWTLEEVLAGCSHLLRGEGGRAGTRGEVCKELLWHFGGRTPGGIEDPAGLKSQGYILPA